MRAATHDWCRGLIWRDDYVPPQLVASAISMDSSVLRQVGLEVDLNDSGRLILSRPSGVADFCAVISVLYLLLSIVVSIVASHPIHPFSLLFPSAERRQVEVVVCAN